MEFCSNYVFDRHVGWLVKGVENHARRQPVGEDNREWKAELTWNCYTIRAVCNLVCDQANLFWARVVCVMNMSPSVFSWSCVCYVSFSNKSLLKPVEFNLELTRRERLLLVYVDVALHNATGWEWLFVVEKFNVELPTLKHNVCLLTLSRSHIFFFYSNNSDTGFWIKSF